MLIRKMIVGAVCLLLAAGLLTPAVRAAVQVVIPAIDAPMRLVAPIGDARLFVLQQDGHVRLFDQQGAALGTFLDISSQTSPSNERGLLGLAFPPDYGTTGRFYVTYTDPAGAVNLARFRVQNTDPNQADASSQEIILTVPIPTDEHIAGDIAFGPDGKLYLALGDGEYGGDPGNRAQDPQQLLGKILRLDVSVPSGYAVPSDNPFVGLPARGEIWALGLRNPFCFSFDRLTGDLYIGDVGESVYEEINIQPASSGGGENYGWRLMAGPVCFNPSAGCEPDTLAQPAYVYTHAGGSTWRCAVIGGHVYRGQSLPSLQGQYFFADFCSGQIWSLAWTEAGGAGAVIDRSGDMTPSGGYQGVTSFGQDGLGGLYILDYVAGSIYRVVSASSDAPEVPGRRDLAQNFPNPFNPRTEIAFTVDTSATPTTLRIYDAAGRLVRTLVSRVLEAGDHVVSWNGTDDHGGRLPSGMYIYRMESGGTQLSRKMVMLE